MEWPEITKDTPLKELKRIHQDIWQYVMDHGEKPSTPYTAGCVACEYVYQNRYKPMDPVSCYNICPIAWSESATLEGCSCGVEFLKWWKNMIKENAQIIRDIPFKYELEESIDV